MECSEEKPIAKSDPNVPVIATGRNGEGIVCDIAGYATFRIVVFEETATSVSSR